MSSLDPQPEIRLTLDRDQWCALIGGDLQSGVAGFGITPIAALERLRAEILESAETLPETFPLALALRFVEGWKGMAIGGALPVTAVKMPFVEDYLADIDQLNFDPISQKELIDLIANLAEEMQLPAAEAYHRLSSNFEPDPELEAALDRLESKSQSISWSPKSRNG